MSGRTLQLSAQTARAKSRNDDSSRLLRKMTAKSARDDRKQCWPEIATSMEQASDVADTRKPYQLIRQVSVSCYAPSEVEVADAIRKLRNNKAPGADDIPAEIYKSCVDNLAPWLHEVIEQAWRDDVVSDDWGLGILVPTPKQCDTTRCGNYRGVSLFDVAAKIFAIGLLRPFRAVRDSRTRPNQDGFRAGHGCTYQILTLRRILEFRHSYQQPTAVCFIDFAVAFDSVHHLSFNKISKIENLENLENLEDLSLFSNSISVIENLDKNTKLRFLSLGRNNISSLKNILYLRQFKHLDCLTIDNNPLCDEDGYENYIFAFLGKLKYLDYKYILPQWRAKAYDKYQIAVDQMNEAQLEYEERVVEAHKEALFLEECKKAFIDEIIGDNLFNAMFAKDKDGQALIKLSSVAELVDQYPLSCL
ncbi:Dynein regulatory complex subunit 3 [Sparganum proliferum]